MAERTLSKFITTLFLLVVSLASCVAQSPWLNQPEESSLAHCPVVVVGYWPKAKRIPVANTLGGYRTQLIVSSALKGTVKPGVLDVMSERLEWSDGGSMIQNTYNDVMVLEQADLTRPSIWFLHPEQVHSADGDREYLCLDELYDIQSLKLRPFFEALLSPSRERNIRALLQSSDRDLCQRALSYICGTQQPWPYIGVTDPPEMKLPAAKDRDFAQIGAIKQLVTSKNGKNRPFATALYAEMAGRASIQLMRSLLSDRDRGVRLVAAGWLVRLRDTTALPGVNVAISAAVSADPLESPLDGEATLAVIRQIAESRSLVLVPGLIPFLDCRVDASGCYYFGDKPWIAAPATFAQSASAVLTGYWFPFDSKAALRAWHKAAGLNPRKRARRLRTMLGDWKCPLRIVVRMTSRPRAGKRTAGQQEPLNSAATVANDSKHTITVENHLDDFELHYSSHETSSGTSHPLNFVTLHPGQSFHCDFAAPDHTFDRTAKPSLSFLFDYLPKKHEVGAWAGVAPATIDFRKKQTPPR